MITRISNVKKQIDVLPGFNRRTTLLVDVSQAFHILWTIGSYMLEAGSISASITTYLLFPLYLGYALVIKNTLLLKLVLFGFSCGWLNYLRITMQWLCWIHWYTRWMSPCYGPLRCTCLLHGPMYWCGWPIWDFALVNGRG